MDMTVDQIDFTSELSKDAKKLLNISPQDREVVFKNHDLTPKEVADMVMSVREWIKKQPHLPADKIRDQQILGYLILRKFSVEKVKHTIDDLISARHRMPDILCNRDPLGADVTSYLKHGLWILMPQKTPENYRITIFRTIKVEEYSIATVLKIATMLADYRVWNDASMGDCWIYDLEHTTLQHVLQMTPVMISNIVYYFLGAFGARLKSVHIINMPPFAASVLNIFKKFMKAKIADRVLLASKEDLLKTFPKNTLPKEYGGEGGTCDEIAGEWCKTIQAEPWRQYFIEQNNIFTDESKRLTPSVSNDIFGDQQILGYLILRKFSVEKVKHTIDDLISARHRMPDILCNRDPLGADVTSYLKHGLWILMPQKTPENYRITIFRTIKVEEYSIATVLKIATMLADYRVWNDASMGDCWIYDLEHTTLQHVLQMTPVMISNIVYYFLGAFGARLKSVHIINMPPFAASVLNIFKKFMKAKIADRVLLASKEDLLKTFPKNTLPKEYGGEGGTCDEIAGEWCKTIQAEPWRQYFIEQNNIFTDESKRLTPSVSNDIFGENGSFRQMCLD